MKRTVIPPIGLGLGACLSLALVANAQHDHGQPLSKAQSADHAPQDERVPLSLGPAAEAGLKLTMREHLEAIRDIVAALGREEFDQAAGVAKQELGFRKHHQAMEREAGATFPSEYHELAMAHHREAEDLAAAIPSHDLKVILPYLDKTIGTCVSYHRAFKL